LLILDPGQNLPETLVLDDGGMTDALQLVEGGVRQRPAFPANLQPPIRKIIDIDHFAAKANRHAFRLKRQLHTILQTVVIASAGLLLAAAIPLARDGLTGPVTIAIALVCFVLLLTTKIDTLWMILGAALVSLTASSFGLIQAL
jgi:hypothetical protein